MSNSQTSCTAPGDGSHESQHCNGNKLIVKWRTSHKLEGCPIIYVLLAYPPYSSTKFEGLHGKWYPQWASTVSSTLNITHNHRVDRWGPVRAGPIIVAKPRNNISAGWAYSEVNPKGVAYLKIIDSIKKVNRWTKYESNLLTHDEHCGYACTAILYVAIYDPNRRQNPPRWNRKLFEIQQRSCKQQRSFN